MGYIVKSLRIFPKEWEQLQVDEQEAMRKKCKYSIKVHQKSKGILANRRKKCAFILTGEIIEIETNYAPQGW